MLMGAVKKVMKTRGDASTGWSRAWKVCVWARLLEGDRAESILNGCLSEQTFKSLFSNCSDAMQVDGAFGAGAGITEMLMQSHEGYIEVLPALPKNWAKGRFSGVVTRGAFELDYAWADGKVTQLKVVSRAGNPCKLKSPAPIKVTNHQNRMLAGTPAENGTWTFATEAGGTYQVRMTEQEPKRN